MTKNKKELGCKVIEFADRDDWKAARLGKITGTRLGNILPKKDGSPKKAFWEMIAEKVATEPDGENPMERGLRLEEEAIERFEKETGKKVKRGLTLCVSPENDKIAYSSDGIISDTEDVEVKCLNSASHIEAWYTKEIPTEYHYQVLQGFIVNKNLKTRHFVFYDPRVECADFVHFTLKREDFEEEVEEVKKELGNIINAVDKIILSLSGF